jgi:CRP-like cAMP-binding protein/Fe-S-cluster-containing dehydrogenase component
MPGEFDEFDLLLGDQLVTMGRSQMDLFGQGNIELTIDGHKVVMNRVKPSYDASGKIVSTRLNTIYDAATQLYCEQLGEPANPIPLLCHREHMTPVAACRACVVEQEKFHRLVPSCYRSLEPGMVIKTIRTSEKVQQTAKMIVEMLMTDHDRPREQGRQYGENELETLAKRLDVKTGRLPKPPKDRGQDDSSLVIAVDHNACILCDRCVRACGEVRKNYVIGRAGKGYSAKIAFDLDDPMGNSSCVACGECMVSCPTGALSSRAVIDVKPWRDTTPAPQPVKAEELKSQKLFQGVSDAFLRWNDGSVVRRTFQPGEVICKEGEFGSTAFVIESGKVEVRIRTPLSHVRQESSGGFGLLGRVVSKLVNRSGEKREGESGGAFIPVDAPVSLRYDKPVAVLTPDDIIFGEMTCMSNYPRAATVIAAEPTTVLEVLRNVLYVLQRNKVSRKLLDDVYRRRSLDSHLRSVRLFAEILKSDIEFQRFVDFVRPRVQLIRVYPGQVIFRQGDKADHFYMVRVGFVKVGQSRPGGEAVLNYVGPGGYFGEIGLLSDLPELRDRVQAGIRTATCSALDHVDLVRITGDDFRQLLAEFPEMRQQFVAEAKQRMEKNEQERMQIERVPLDEFLSQGLQNAQSLLVLDLQKCTRCDECTKACADAHDGVTRLIREGLRFDKYLVASSCRSCMDPYCLVGCPVGSIRRVGSKEIVIEDWCIGCGKCAVNCPYGNINMHGFVTDEKAIDPLTGHKAVVVRQKATSCDLCRNIDGQPSCVYACPHDAAHRMTGQELLKIVRNERS